MRSCYNNNQFEHNNIYFDDIDIKFKHNNKQPNFNSNVREPVEPMCWTRLGGSDVLQLALRLYLLLSVVLAV